MHYYGSSLHIKKIHPQDKRSVHFNAILMPLHSYDLWNYVTNSWKFWYQPQMQFSENIKGWYMVYEAGAYSLY